MDERQFFFGKKHESYLFQKLVADGELLISFVYDHYKNIQPAKNFLWKITMAGVAKKSEDGEKLIYIPKTEVFP